MESSERSSPQKLAAMRIAPEFRLGLRRFGNGGSFLLLSSFGAGPPFICLSCPSLSASFFASFWPRSTVAVGVPVCSCLEGSSIGNERAVAALVKRCSPQTVHGGVTLLIANRLRQRRGRVFHELRHTRASTLIARVSINSWSQGGSAIVRRAQRSTPMLRRQDRDAAKAIEGMLKNSCVHIGL